MSYFIHQSSFVDENVTIGNNTKIWHFSHILKNTVIGDDCVFGQNCMVGPNVRIGRNAKIQNNISIYDGVIIEDDVFLGPSMVFTNVINPRSFINRKEEFKKTLVKKGASIGANATVVCGTTIGCYAFVGAGSVITKEVPDYGLVYGNPGKLMGWMCYCGLRLEFTGKEAICSQCSKKYKKISEKKITEI